MTERGYNHLDSRRTESGEDRKYGDYLVNLDDIEAVETSPFRHALEGLRELGLTSIYISCRNFGDTEYPDDQWMVHGHKKIQGHESIIAYDLSKNLDVCATISESGARELEFSFGEYNYQNFDPNDLNEMVWGYLEVIHGMLCKSRAGAGLPREFGEAQRK